ncbi:MAG: GntR family transcriptional regulator, partial [Lachnospiraceae bacterium]|nr:GntR family transcriptional regulator [Lachnospiraceae bacterium]
AGTILPSIRKLAKETGVSVITTTRAYNDLEEQGFIASMQGRGSVVLSKDNQILKEQYLIRVEEGLLTAVETAKRIDMREQELHDMITSLWKETEL